MAESGSVSFKRIKRRKKMTASDKVFCFFVYAFFLLFAFVTVYPILRTLAYSFSDPYLMYKSSALALYYPEDTEFDGIWFLPKGWSFTSYKWLLVPDFEYLERTGIIQFTYPGLQLSFAVTLLRTIIGTITGLLANALLAFILSRRKFVFKSFLSVFWIFTMYASAGLIPTYVLYSKLHLTGTFWVYIIPGMVSALNVIVMRTYMQAIPDSLEEAARLEGADYMKIFWSIISPLCKPLYAAIALFTAAYHWNAWFDSMFYNRFEPRYRTLIHILEQYYTVIPSSEGVEYHSFYVSAPIKAAVTIIAMAPLLIVYPFLQKYFVTGLTIGGVKE